MATPDYLRRFPPPPPPPPNPFLPDCKLCQQFAEPLLCREGRTQVYAEDKAECARFEAEAVAFDELIRGWTTVLITNATARTMPSLSRYELGTTVEMYPGCRAALETFFCTQQDVYQDPEVGDGISGCNEYRRPYMHGGRCLSFCPAIRAACPAAAHAMCETRCRAASFGASGFCPVLEIYGMERSAWDEDTLDIMNVYRLEAEADAPILRDQRPAYRSIPARRPAGSARATKLDYYLYATRLKGYTEWLFDTNDVDSDGAAAYVSSADLVPYDINSEWTVWRREQREWSTAHIHIRCRNEGSSASSAAPRWRGWRGGRFRAGSGADSYAWGLHVGSTLAAASAIAWCHARARRAGHPGRPR